MSLQSMLACAQKWLPAGQHTCFWVTTPRSARRRPIRVLFPASTWPSTTRCSLVLPPAQPGLPRVWHSRVP